MAASSVMSPLLQGTHPGSRHVVSFKIASCLRGLNYVAPSLGHLNSLKSKTVLLLLDVYILSFAKEGTEKSTSSRHKFSLNIVNILSLHRTCRSLVNPIHLPLAIWSFLRALVLEQAGTTNGPVFHYPL